MSTVLEILKQPVCKRMISDFLKSEREYIRNPNRYTAETYAFRCGEAIGYLVAAPNIESCAASNALSLIYQHYYRAKARIATKEVIL